MDQYRFGNGPLGTGRNVTKILTNVVAGLLEDPARRFSYVEQAYFSDFYESRSPPVREAIRGLVARKQLVFLNGGFSMVRRCTGRRAARRGRNPPHAFSLLRFL